MQAEAIKALEQTGALDKLLGPQGGLVLSLAAVGFLGWHLLKTQQKHQERLEERDAEIKRLSDARVTEERARSESARELMERVERYQDKTDARWAKLGQVLARIELTVRAVGKKAGAPPPKVPPPDPMPGEGAQDVSMF